MADWNGYLEQALNSIAGSIQGTLNHFYASKNSEIAALYDSYLSKEKQLQAEKNQGYREAYINKMQNLKNAGGYLDSIGVSGGASESFVSGLLRDYGNRRNDVLGQYTKGSSELYDSYQKNRAKIETDYAKIFADIQNKQRQLMLQSASIAQKQAQYETTNRIKNTKSTKVYPNISKVMR